MDVRKLDLNLLVTLETLLNERNVTRAAEKLGLSQPTVSAQLARLRDLFDDQLLIPAQRGMTPTARALELHVPLRQALDGVRDTISGGDSFDPATAELTIAIGGADLSHHAITLPLAVQLQQRAPNVRLALRDVVWSQIDKDLETGNLDCALIVPAAASPSMRARVIAENSWKLIARKDHPLVRGAITLDTFCALDHVLTEPGQATFAGVTDEVLKNLGRSRRVALSVAEFMLAIEAVVRSDMLAVVPQIITFGREDILQVLDPPLEMPGSKLLLAWHERTHGHAGHRWFRNEIAQFVEQRAPSR